MLVSACPFVNSENFSSRFPKERFCEIDDLDYVINTRVHCFRSVLCHVGLAVKHLGVMISTTYIYLVSAVTATASIILLGEPFTTLIVIGLVMTIGGLLLSQNKS